MPNLQQTNPSTVYAIVCGDIHLSHKPPIARSAEPNWYDAMTRPLDEIVGLQKKHKCPVICAGDIFDKWNAPAELINFAFRWIQQCIAIPGNHDLPFHNYEDREKSAYWTLVMADRIISLDPTPFAINNMRLHGFPCGFEPVPLNSPCNLQLEVAIVHQYIWKKGCSYPDAPQSNRVTNIQKKLDGYDCAVFSDNHIPFEWKMIFNCGSMIRRKIDEITHRPSVGLLMSDGSFKRHYLDCSQDKFIDTQDGKVIDSIGMNSFVEELTALSDSAINYSEAVHALLKREKVSDSVKTIILAAMEKQ
jgi:hypothetical protein